MNVHILYRHLSWINAGYSFCDIMAIRDALIDLNPFVNVGSKEIDEHLGLSVEFKNEIDFDGFNRINFILIDDCDFDGDLTFLTACDQLESLFVSGISSKSKVLNIEALAGLTKLKFLDLSYNAILDISPISKLENLEELYLFQNPYQSIETLTELRNLKKLNVYCEDELIIDRILKSSSDCLIHYCNRNEQECYTTDFISRELIKNN